MWIFRNFEHMHTHKSKRVNLNNVQSHEVFNLEKIREVLLYEINQKLELANTPNGVLDLSEFPLNSLKFHMLPEIGSILHNNFSNGLQILWALQNFDEYPTNLIVLLILKALLFQEAAQNLN